MSVLVPRERIEQTILLIRGHRVMLSTVLTDLYAVEPRVRIQAVKRNRDRFPVDFMFQLTEQEFDHLKSQITISSWGGLRRAYPYAFTEQGVAMRSSAYGMSVPEPRLGMAQCLMGTEVPALRFMALTG